MNVIKRNGTEVPFDENKIRSAITKANNSVPEDARMTELQIRRITESVEFSCIKMGRAPSVEEIQDMVEYQIMAHGAYEVSKNYITYRYNRSLIRRSNTTDEKILSLIDCSQERSRRDDFVRNTAVNSAQRRFMAGEVSRDLTERILLDREIVEAHHKGILHFHDSDYFALHMHNCTLVNLEDALQNGTVLNGIRMGKPDSFSQACMQTMQIAAHAALEQYGEQTVTLTHLAPFVDVSRKNIRSACEREMTFIRYKSDEQTLSKLTEMRLREEIARGIRILLSQSVCMPGADRNPAQPAFFVYLNEARSRQEQDDLALIIRELFIQRMQGISDAEGKRMMPDFPKLLYVLEENNLPEGSGYRELTQLAAKLSAEGEAICYISEKKMKEQKGDVYPCMGSHAFLAPDRFTDNGIGNIAKASNYEPGKHRYYGRFSQGTVTLNLPDAALSSGGNMKRFREILDERLELCHRALRRRHERLLGTVSDAAPVLWQHAAAARLDQGEVIDSLLYNGYSTISLGFAGLYECVKYMTGKSHTDPQATPFALEIMQRMNEKCAQWKKEENIEYSLYGVSQQDVTRKFAGCLKAGFGVMEDITDKESITGGFEVPESSAVSVKEKLIFEDRFQALSPGGGFSCARVRELREQPGKVLEMLEFLYGHVMYAELVCR